jgi:hypothetical protein
MNMKDRDTHYRKRSGHPLSKRSGHHGKDRENLRRKFADTHRLPEQEPNDDIPPLQETEFKPFASAWKTGAILLFWDRVKASTLFEEM